MNSKLNPISVGTFVICGVAMIVVAMIFFQSFFFIHKPLRFISYFDESVQGLDVGSNVRIRGVSIGHVASITVQYDWKTKQSRVAVLCELNKNSIVDAVGNVIQISDPSILNQLIKDGLCAKIDLVGITGLQFVQLDFLDSEKYVENNLSSHAAYPVVPTVNSGMSRLTDNLVAIADNVRSIDFAKLSKDVEETARELTLLIRSVHEETEGLQLKKMTSHITSAANSVEQLADYLDQHPSSLIFGRKPADKSDRASFFEKIKRFFSTIFNPNSNGHYPKNVNGE